MSVTSEITRIQTARNTLRAKGVELGIVLSTDRLDEIAEKFDDDLVDQGNVTATVEEGETYTIPAGYHRGTGTVSGVSGGGNYNLQSKTVTPTKTQQVVTPDTGNYGLSDVTVAPIPDAYQDVTSVTAVASEVLANKIIVDSDGDTIAGTMANNGAVAATMDGLTVQSYTIPAGYHSGSGTVSMDDSIETALASI